jgi:hypothetical protein
MKPKKPKTDLYKLFMAVGVPLIVANGYKGFTHLENSFYNTSEERVCSFALFFITCLWLGSWIYFDFEEIHKIEEYLDSPLVKFTGFPFISVISVVVISYFLFSSTDNPGKYLLIASLYWIIGGVGLIYTRRTLKMLIKSDEKFCHGACYHINDYYMNRPFYLLDSFAMSLMIIGYSLSKYSLLYLNGDTFLNLFIFTIAIFTVLMHEGILFGWRFQRNKKIDEEVKL